MKILFFSDIHVNFRHRTYMGFLERTLEEIRKDAEGMDLVFNLGDTTDTFGVVDIRDLLFAQEHTGYHRFKGGGAGLYTLRGNHDTGDKLGEQSTLPLFLLLSHQFGFEDMAVFTPFDGEDQPRFLIVPHTRDYPAVYEFLLEAKGRGPVTAVLTHTDWLGCRLTPQYVSKEGLEPAWFQANLPGVPVFAGHYHTPMNVGPVHIVGSPLYATFNDRAEGIPRGWLKWDTESGEIVRVTNPHTYECHSVRAKGKKELKKSREGFEGKENRCKVKVYVPKRLFDDAQELYSGFLWSGVYPLENDAEGVEFESKVDLNTEPEAMVERAVKGADAVYDKTLLRKYGEEAFSV